MLWKPSYTSVAWNADDNNIPPLKISVCDAGHTSVVWDTFAGLKVSAISYVIQFFMQRERSLSKNGHQSVQSSSLSSFSKKRMFTKEQKIVLRFKISQQTNGKNK